jgi:hypothetical protein
MEGGDMDSPATPIVVLVVDGVIHVGGEIDLITRSRARRLLERD